MFLENNTHASLDCQGESQPTSATGHRTVAERHQIIVTAVGDEFTLAHPEGQADMKMAAAIAGGPAIYLIGTLLFRRAVTGLVGETVEKAPYARSQP